jgi:hypothetical protein
MLGLFSIPLPSTLIFPFPGSKRLNLPNLIVNEALVGDLGRISFRVAAQVRNFRSAKQKSKNPNCRNQRYSPSVNRVYYSSDPLLCDLVPSNSVLLKKVFVPFCRTQGARVEKNSLVEYSPSRILFHLSLLKVFL